MFPYTNTDLMLTLHEERLAQLRAEAARYRLARAVRPAPAHRRRLWWSRLTGHRTATTRAPAHS
jgi:hypothetical protein